MCQPFWTNKKLMKYCTLFTSKTHKKHCNIYKAKVISASKKPYVKSTRVDGGAHFENIDAVGNFFGQDII